MRSILLILCFVIALAAPVMEVSAQESTPILVDEPSYTWSTAAFLKRKKQFLVESVQRCGEKLVQPWPNGEMPEYQAFDGVRHMFDAAAETSRTVSNAYRARRQQCIDDTHKLTLEHSQRVTVRESCVAVIENKGVIQHWSPETIKRTVQEICGRNIPVQLEPACIRQYRAECPPCPSCDSIRERQIRYEQCVFVLSSATVQSACLLATRYEILQDCGAPPLINESDYELPSNLRLHEVWVPEHDRDTLKLSSDYLDPRTMTEQQSKAVERRWYAELAKFWRTGETCRGLAPPIAYCLTRHWFADGGTGGLQVYDKVADVHQVTVDSSGRDDGAERSLTLTCSYTLKPNGKNLFIGQEDRMKISHTNKVVRARLVRYPNRWEIWSDGGGAILKTNWRYQIEHGF